MANSKTIWRGQSATLTIGSLQTATTGSKHIDKYVFYNDTSELAGLSQLDTSSTVVTAETSVNAEKNYVITSYLLYKHNFADSTTVATSNKVDNTLIVHEPLDTTSLVKIEPVGENWVWSNATGKTFAIKPTFNTYAPYSKFGQYISDSIDKTAAKGSIASSSEDDISTNFELAWLKTTGTTTDLGAATKNIIITVKSSTRSAPSAVIIPNKSATFVVRNAVTGLSGLSNRTLYAGSAKITQTVRIAPAIPYDKTLVLVDNDGQSVTGNSIATSGGAKVSLSGQTVTLDASAVKVGTATQTIKFKVRSTQSASSVDTDFVTFVVNAVTNITGQSVVEGQKYTIESVGIGTIKSATVTTGSTAASVAISGSGVTITGLAVDTDTDWVITVTNSEGATITISGKTTHLNDVSVNINTGDYIIVGADVLTGLTEGFTIVTKPSKGTAAISSGKLRFDASTTAGAIAAGTYPIKVKGANGATQTVNIVVTNITATLA